MNLSESGAYYKEALDAAAMSCIPVSPKIDFGDLSINVSLPDAIDSSLGNMPIYLQKYIVSRYLLTSIDIFDDQGNSLIYDSDGNKLQNLRVLSPGDSVTVEVTHNYVMRIPLINKLFFKMYWLDKVKEELGFSELSFIDGFISDILDYIELPYYWIPICAASTLTVQGHGDSAK
jgi:hypothetical protein